MDEQTRQRERDDVDGGMTAAEVLERTASAARQQRNQAEAELGAMLTDAQVLDLYGLDMVELRRGTAVDGVWSLP